MICDSVNNIFFPFSVSSQFPPDEAARSIITDPGFIELTVSLSIRTGAFFPGIWAVAITTSAAMALC